MVQPYFVFRIPFSVHLQFAICHAVRPEALRSLRLGPNNACRSDLSAIACAHQDQIPNKLATADLSAIASAHQDQIPNKLATAEGLAKAEEA
jgi:hypothetical protein